ncbi:hypothetical protein EVAR_79861_1 [Eumeta japonica]|uniref:Uncharacterized protein n=1 Tax=Eumeta variegata TaxID=151549 RepID=A0A4C1TYV8_EUMVA|nr:hypothetical protein EVAR_79861_1 [Eumeta japonica]
MASTRESYSSESSGYNHDSPNYSKYTNRNKYINDNENPDSSDDDEWDGSIRSNMHRVIKDEAPNVKSESENEEDNRLVYENERYQIRDIQNLTRDFSQGIDECDYDIEIDSGQTSINNEPPVIYVFAVDPELDLEYTSEEEDWQVKQNEDERVDSEHIVSNENEDNIQTSTLTSNESEEAEHIQVQQNDDKIDLSFEMPAIINVDDFFIKENKDHVKPINVEDGPVVSNVDEYFIKDSRNTTNANEEIPTSSSIDENKQSMNQVLVKTKIAQQHQTCSIPRDIKKEPLYRRGSCEC